MLPKNLKTPLGILRISIVVLGLLILIIGCVSHYQSTWLAEDWHLTVSSETRTGPFRDIVCELIAKPSKKPCPNISMETYFVVMTILCLILSLIFLFASVIVDLSKGLLKRIDLIYHCVASVLLLIAAIVYLVSAYQIDALTKNINGPVKSKRNEKIAAASLTFIQVALYTVAVLLIARS